MGCGGNLVVVFVQEVLPVHGPVVIAVGIEFYADGGRLTIGSVSIIRDMNKPPSDNSLYNLCCNVDVLLLDEVGAEDKTAVVWGNRCTPLQDILVYRYDRRRITVLSSNCDNGELLDRYGERVMDRIRESYTRVLFSHESYRTIE